MELYETLVYGGAKGRGWVPEEQRFYHDEVIVQTSRPSNYWREWLGLQSNGGSSNGSFGQSGFNFMNAGFTGKTESSGSFWYGGALVIPSSWMQGGGAITLPPFIIIDKNDPDKKGTIRHEYGHILQNQILSLFPGGMVNYYIGIGLPSLISAGMSDSNMEHQQNFSEKSANQLSYWFHGSPADWNFTIYPVYSK
jgi:hypothetical protein